MRSGIALLELLHGGLVAVERADRFGSDVIDDVIVAGVVTS